MEAAMYVYANNKDENIFEILLRIPDWAEGTKIGSLGNAVVLPRYGGRIRAIKKERPNKNKWQKQK
jgi:hypothetical protein